MLIPPQLGPTRGSGFVRPAGPASTSPVVWVVLVGHAIGRRRADHGITEFGDPRGVHDDVGLVVSKHPPNWSLSWNQGGTRCFRVFRWEKESIHSRPAACFFSKRCKCQLRTDMESIDTK